MTEKLMSVAACLMALTSTAVAQTDFREALRIAFPATVTVQTDEDGAGPQGRMLRRQIGPMGGFDMMQGLAVSADRTGFAVSADLIATQISSDIEDVTIKTADGKQLAGKIVSRDHVTGLTLIKIDGTEFVSLLVGAGVPEAGLPVVLTRLGASGAASAESGMIASAPAAIDSQLGFTQFVSANMNRSDSGAPIVDAKGVVVGIAGEGGDGQLLCLPTEPLQRLIDGATGDQPISSKRGLVGIQFARGDKPVVTEVSEGSPADDAGIESGDRVVRVNQYDVTTSEDVLAAVAMSRAGDAVSIVVERDDQTIELVVTLKDHPRQEFAPAGSLAGAVTRQAWELRDGKLVPLDGDDARVPRQFKGFMQKDLEKMFENFPENNLILPGLPKRLEGIEVERSELEDSLRDQEEEIKDLKKKLRDLQDKLEDS